MSQNFDMNTFVENFRHNCSRVQVKKFSKGETVTTYIEKRSQICILIDGEADLIRYDLNGNKTIIGHFVKNDAFGEVFYPASTNNELFVLARKNSTVLFFEYNDILEKCKRNCSFHHILYSNLTELFLTKVIDLNMRIELLTQKTIRDKLISYFDMLSLRRVNRSFAIPFSYTDLADYLSVDRSAMMREIKSLIEDGIIKKSGNKITWIN